MANYPFWAPLNSKAAGKLEKLIDAWENARVYNEYQKSMSSVLKELYGDVLTKELVYTDNPFLKMIKKDEKP